MLLDRLSRMMLITMNIYMNFDNPAWLYVDGGTLSLLTSTMNNSRPLRVTLMHWVGIVANITSLTDITTVYCLMNILYAGFSVSSFQGYPIS